MKVLIRNVVLLMIIGIISSTVIAGEINQIKNGEQSLVTSVIDRTITYQGILKTSSGTAVPNSTYNLTFRIYDQSSGGSALWTSIAIPVMTSSGLFSTLLGPISLPFDTTYYVSIQVAGDVEMSRQMMTMSPYSASADTANYAKAAIGDSKWSFRITDTADTILVTGGRWGIARNGNVLWGNADSTHVNLGVQCTTGTSGYNNKYCTVGGGYRNIASGYYSTVGGGYRDSSGGDYSTIGGGYDNTASRYYSAIGGGAGNISSGDASVIGGGAGNAASGSAAAIGGGYENTASDLFSSIGGGYSNTASGYSSAIGGGYLNAASGGNTTIGGGFYNTASGSYSAIGGGSSDTVNAVYGGVASGYSNLAGNDAVDTGAFVGGGYNNSANGPYSFVGGGINNMAGDSYSTVSGGMGNSAIADAATVSGGRFNYIFDGLYATIGGGEYNRCEGDFSCIPGGRRDTIDASGHYSLVYGYGVYCNDDYRVTFFDGSNYGSLNINRDGRDGYNSYPIQVGTLSSSGLGAYLSIAGVWTNSSSRTFKENFTPFDGPELLRKISALSVTTYNYKNSTEKHIGPVAEEFVGAFDTGVIRESDGKRDDQYLAGSDVAGVALAGVQELLKKIEYLENKNDQLERRITELEKK
jgi:trimeric autotransporter adhesin